MGLDVYLYKCADLASANALEALYNQKSEEIWGSYPASYNDMSEADKEAANLACKEVAISLGLDKRWGSSPAKEQIEIDSKLYPEHMFKIGYFRSSYNDGGINNMLRRMGLPDLYYVFEPYDEYEFFPNWKLALNRVNELIREFKKISKSDTGKYDVFCASENMFGNPDLPTDENQALDIFINQLEGHRKNGLGSYSNIHGEFMLKGEKVFAVIHGRKHNVPCVYVVFEKDTEGVDWYLHALEIVKETIEFVLNDPDKDQYFLHWSS